VSVWVVSSAEVVLVGSMCVWRAVAALVAGGSAQTLDSAGIVALYE